MGERFFAHYGESAISDHSRIRPFHPPDFVIRVADEQVGVGFAFHAHAGAGVQDEELGGRVAETGAHGDFGRQDDGIFDTGGFNVIECGSGGEDHGSGGDQEDAGTQDLFFADGQHGKGYPKHGVENQGDPADRGRAELVFPEKENPQERRILFPGFVLGQGQGVGVVEMQVRVVWDSL
ncbi:hypothetical protein DESC_720152 [Desulfosarcina cetonica]|nr:hypothetical protein DESC_720152 [Desulfosarcina cetonica]